MKHHTQIDGWFDHAKTYDFLLSTIPNSGTFVECGAWLGKSSSYLCDNAKDRIKVFIVDTWKGSDNEVDTYHELAKKTDIYKIFLDNMGQREFIPIRKLSKDAVLDFEDNSCDVVFIDMNHSYESVLEDITIWLPKIKTGGYLSGDDYNKENWPGVVSAVNEVFDSKNLLFLDDCWIFKKNE